MMMDNSLFGFWKANFTAPYLFPMSEQLWAESMYADTDSDGRKLFQTLHTKELSSELDGSIQGMIQYGQTAFGFDDSGEISDQIHYNVIRMLCFRDSEAGQKLLDAAVSHFPHGERICAYFHYFGMSACARHGKLHENQSHVHALLLRNGFIVEHENVYYSKVLSGSDESAGIRLRWSGLNAGNCRDFAAVLENREVCWGQVHFLPQGDIAYLRWIFTDEQLQHQGIGTKVMHQLFFELGQMGISRFDTDTAQSNTIAQTFYEKIGFTNEGITRSYYTA